MAGGARKRTSHPKWEAKSHRQSTQLDGNEKTMQEEWKIRRDQIPEIDIVLLEMVLDGLDPSTAGYELVPAGGGCAPVSGFVPGPNHF